MLISMKHYTHIKSRVEAAPDVELFPYILDNTRECYYFSNRGSFLYGSQWDQCSTTLIKVESYAEITLTSARTSLLLVKISCSISHVP